MSRIISVREIDAIVPTRMDFIKDTETIHIKAGSPIEFLFHTNEIHDNIMYVCGVFKDGQKGLIKVHNVPFIIDLRMIPSEFERLITNLGHPVRVIKTESILRKPFHGYVPEPIKYLRIHFATFEDRNKFLNLLPKNIEHATDARQNNYYNMICALYHFKSAGWNIISGYTNIPKDRSSNVQHILQCSINDITASTYEARPKLLLRSWDIETYSENNNGDIPTPNDIDYYIDMVNSSYTWYDRNDKLLTISCCRWNTDLVENTDIVIVCKSEVELLEADMQIIKRLQPDFHGAFNGANFDWPLYIEKLYRNGAKVQKSKFTQSKRTLMRQGRKIPYMLDTQHFKEGLLTRFVANSYAAYNVQTNMDSNALFRFRNRTAKIAGTGQEHHLDICADILGAVDFDYQPMFIKLYAKGEETGRGASLNYFLKRQGLELKQDLPYQVLKKIFLRARMLEKAPNMCHCDELIDGSHSTCKVCASLYPEIDHIRISYDEITKDIIYSDQLLPEISNKCCFCGKRKVNLKSMAEAISYCTIDCVRPQQIQVKNELIHKPLTLANMTFVSAKDGILCADGMKIVNLIFSNTPQFGLAMSYTIINSYTTKGEIFFEGAYVFKPKIGIHNDRPVMDIDFNSLYPSVIIAFNISPETYLPTQADIDAAIAAGYNIRKFTISYEIGEKKHSKDNIKKTTTAHFIAHNNVFDTNDKQIITGYNMKIKYIMKDKSIIILNPEDPAPDNFSKCEIIDEAIRGRERLVDEHAGIFGFTLKKLFDKRIPLKDQMLALADKLKTMDSRDPDYASTLEQHNEIDAVQYALKILQNTFYGKLGDKNCPFYNPAISGSVTKAGVQTILLLQDYMLAKNYEIIYGDTDSLYLKCPMDVMEPANRIWNMSQKTIDDKKQYWRHMAVLTHAKITHEIALIGIYMCQVTGSRQLNVSSDALVMPYVIFSKKKIFWDACR